MDQERFDLNLMDYLFDELDEVTCAAMKRKLDSDQECRAVEAGLRATLQVAQLPTVEPDEDLERRILQAADLAQLGEPWTRKLLRLLSWAGSHAMRPQLAMAAILMLVVGSSVLLLRARPGTVAVTPVREAVSQPADTNKAAVAGRQGDLDEAQQKPHLAEAADQVGREAPASAAVPSAQLAKAKVGEAEQKTELGNSDVTAEDALGMDEAYAQALSNYNTGNHSQAQQQFATIKASKSPKASVAGLYEARAVRSHSGCKAAVGFYSSVRATFAGSPAAADATFEQADCHKLLGQNQQHRQLLATLAGNDAYQARVAHELEQPQSAGASGNAVASKRRAKKPSPATPNPQQQQKKKTAAPAQEAAAY